MKIYASILCFIIQNSLHGWFEHQRAISALEKNDLSTAAQLMGQALLDKPFDPARLYDAGVVSYKKGDAQQALNYFQSSAAQENVDKTLLEKVHFNAGNAHVKLNELEQAVEQYDLTLALNPENEHARANKKMVEEMLEKKRQEDEQKKQKQESQEKNKNQQPNQNNAQNQKGGQGQKNDRKQDGSDQERGSQKNDGDNQKR